MKNIWYMLFFVVVISGCAMTTEQVRNTYHSKPNNKVLTLSDNNISGASWGHTSIEKAIDAALSLCAKSGGYNCKVISINGRSKSSTGTQKNDNTRIYSTKYTCSGLSKGRAYELLLQGHNYLDRDGDGHPCEWDSTSYSHRIVIHSQGLVIVIGSAGIDEATVVM